MPRVPEKDRRFRRIRLMRIYHRLNQRVLKEVALTLPRLRVVRALAVYCEVSYGQNLTAVQNGSDYIRNFVDALMFSQFYASKYCPEQDSEGLNNSAIWKFIGRFFEIMKDFALFWDLLLLSFAGNASLKVRRQKILAFRPFSKLDRRLVPADKYWASPESHFDLLLVPDHRFSFGTLFEACAPWSSLSGVLNYTISTEVADEFRRLADMCLRRHWKFDPSWDLCGYTVADFREVWSALLILASVHRKLASHAANMTDFRKENYIDQYVRVQSKQHWYDDVASLVDTPRNRIELIINDLVFDVALLSRPDETPSQPFFKVGDQLLLSPYVMKVAHPEETIFRVLHIRRRRQHSRLVNQRERLQIQRVSDIFSNLPVQVYDDFNVEHNGQRSNLDLLVVDVANRFALACELKWPMNPRWLKDADSTRNTLRKGIGQSLLCVDWLKTGPQSVLQRTGLTPDEWRNFRIEGIVISERALMGVFGEIDASIPLINERILELLLTPAHQCSLCDLWLTAQNYGYLPVEGRHYEIFDPPQTKIFDYQFSRKRMDARELDEFTRAEIRVDRCTTTDDSNSGGYP